MAKHAPELSPRLKQIADMVKPCGRMADIGTDHAYLPIYLCNQGVCQSAVASDIVKGPLKRASTSISQWAMETLIETRLGAGAETLSVGEADCIVIAGMGGLMIGDILAARPEIFSACKQILLQPMTNLFELRCFLLENGYTICEETLAREDAKVYHILSVIKKVDPHTYTQEELYFGPCLLKNRPEHFTYYMEKQQRKLGRMLSGLKKAQNGDTEKQALIQRFYEFLCKGEFLCEN